MVEIAGLPTFARVFAPFRVGLRGTEVALLPGVKIRVSFRRALHALLLCVLAFGPGVTAAAADDVQLVWDPTPEPDLAGYVVLIGTAPRVYTQSVEVGPAQPFASISGLPGGLTYYFAVRAFNTAGLQSGLSNEVSVFVANDTAPAGPAP